MIWDALETLHSVLRCSPSKRGRRKYTAFSAVDSAVIGISINICPSALEQSFRSWETSYISQGYICLLELACPCQAIVVNVSLTWQLSAGTGPICHLGRCWIHFQKRQPLFTSDGLIDGMYGSQAEITGSSLCPVWPLLAAQQQLE